MDRIIQSPGKYIQGADVITRLGDYLKPLADRWLVVGDKFVLGFAQETLQKSLADAGLACEVVPFGGECSQNEIDRLRGVAETLAVAQCSALAAGKRWIPPKRWRTSCAFRWQLRRQSLPPTRRAARSLLSTPTTANSTAICYFLTTRTA